MDDTPSWLPWAAVLVTMVFWASAFVAIRHLVTDFGPAELSLGRITIGAVVLSGFVLLSRRWVPPTAGEWWRIVAIGVGWYAVYHIALNAGERRIDAGTASLLLQASPVLMALAAAVFLNERFTRELAVGLALAFAGVAIIALSGGSHGSSDWIGALLCMVSSVSYVASVILQKPLSARLPALQITWLACVVGAVAQLAFAPALLTQLQEAPTASVWWLVYLGVFPTALAFTTYGYALRHMSAGGLGVTTYLVPPITIVLGLLFLGEAPPPLAYVGGALALVGVAITRRQPAQPVAVRRPAR